MFTLIENYRYSDFGVSKTLYLNHLDCPVPPQTVQFPVAPHLVHLEP
jgi:hypothetical protein